MHTFISIILLVIALPAFLLHNTGFSAKVRRNYLQCRLTWRQKSNIMITETGSYEGSFYACFLHAFGNLLYYVL